MLRTTLLWLALFLLPMTAQAAVPTCDSQWSRSVVDALLNRDLKLAEEQLSAWRLSAPEHASLPLHDALIEVARADYSSDPNTDKYEKPLSLLNAEIRAIEQKLTQSPESYLLRLNQATAQAVAGRLLMEQGRWLKAYRYGHQSRSTMQALLDEDPERHDTYLILGLFDYIAGSLPSVLRWLAVIIDFKGDAQEGIEKLELTVKTAKVAAPQAAEALLIELDHTPQQACRYRTLARTMRRAYPDNPRYIWAISRLARECRNLPLDQRPKPVQLTLAVADCP